MEKVFVLMHDEADGYEFTVHATEESAVEAAMSLIVDNVHRADYDEETRIVHIAKNGSFVEKRELVNDWWELTGNTENLSIIVRNVES